jgi:hypothetical protein
VIVRDETACDFLGTGRPTERLVPGDEPSPTSPPTTAGLDPWIWAALAAGGLALAAALGIYVVRRAR